MDTIKPRIDTTKTHVLVTCNRGHMFAAVRREDWAGSPAEAASSTPRECKDCSSRVA